MTICRNGTHFPVRGRLTEMGHHGDTATAEDSQPRRRSERGRSGHQGCRQRGNQGIAEQGATSRQVLPETKRRPSRWRTGRERRRAHHQNQIKRRRYGRHPQPNSVSPSVTTSEDARPRRKPSGGISTKLPIVGRCQRARGHLRIEFYVRHAPAHVPVRICDHDRMLGTSGVVGVPIGAKSR